MVQKASEIKDSVVKFYDKHKETINAVGTAIVGAAAIAGGIALTVATGGAAGIIIGGALIGGGASLAIAQVSDYADDGHFNNGFDYYAKAFAEGAIIGGVSGGLLTTLTPVLSSAGAVGKGLLTAAATGVGDLVAQKLVNGNVDIKRNLLVAGTAGILSGGASLLSDKLAPKISSGLSKGISKLKGVFASSSDEVVNTTVNSGKRLEPNLQLFGHTADDVVGKGASGADGRTFKSSYDIPLDENGYTKSSLSLGRKVHKEYKVTDFDNVSKFKEYILPSGKRVDYIDFDTKIIYELKPNNSNQIKLGTKQLQGYLDEIESDFGKEWKTVLDTY